MLTEERMIVREGARYWWLFLISGILWLLIAWMVLRLNATSIATVGILLGVVFGLSGINEVGQATLSHGGWKVWHYLLAAIFFLGALYGFIRPVNTFFALASVLGLILIPVLFAGFPSWVGQLAPALLGGLSSIVGVEVQTP